MIGVFTYNIPHRKTYDTLCLLKAGGYDNVIVFADTLHYEKTFKPLIAHRPICNNEISAEKICERFNYDYYNGFDERILPENTKILICGAGIIPQAIIKKYRVINSHPGYLPNVRGLDAFKWAVYYNQPIGVTTHCLGDEVDAGLMIDRKIVPIHYNDTFHSVAQRQYEMEINMLVEAIGRVDVATQVILPRDNDVVRKRMPHELETRIFDKFNELVKRVPIE